ncbi:MAG: TetR family transcriptional regulator [Melioribacteraceae bacterium]|nr:MAG: TetR family transcriptional regulator [Melioribacteraceae bacterium]
MDDKERILEHVITKFLSEGFQKTSMDEIARELKMSKKTIYKHFSSKDELIFATVNNFLNSTSKTIGELVDSKADSLVKIQKITLTMLRLSLKLSQRFISDVKVYKPDLWRKIDEFRSEKFMENFGKLFDQCKKEKIMVDYPNIIILTIMLSSIQGVINPKFLTENNYSAREAGAVVFEIIMSGLLTKKGKKLLKNINRDKE